MAYPPMQTPGATFTDPNPGGGQRLVQRIYVCHYTPLGDRKQRLESILREVSLAPIIWVEEEPSDNCFYQRSDKEWVKKIDFAYAEDPHYQTLRQPRELRRSEISLAYKHWKCYQNIVQGSIETALILEDDVILCNDFKSTLSHYLGQTPEDWDAIFPGSGAGLRITNTRSGEVAYRKEHPASKCTDSYLINGFTAQRLYKLLKTICLPIDIELAWGLKVCNSNVYWWEPPLIIQGSQQGLYRSAIQDDAVPALLDKDEINSKDHTGPSKLAFHNNDLSQKSKTALFFLADRSIYRDRLVSSSEIFFSPDCQTQLDPSQLLCVQTRSQPTDISAYLDPISQQWQPDLIVIKADATQRAWPLNLRSQSAPKVLIVGDTHHLQRPIQSLLGYVEKEQFDVIVSEHDRHHLHYFAEAGHPRAIWLPGFATNPHRRPPQEAYQYPLVFIGSAGQFHPYRRHLLEQIKQQGFPLFHTQAPQTQAADLYNQSLISLNISLNGDLNLRVFEVLAAGGFLLTDRLTPESGLPMLFEDGRHLVTFDSEADLYDKLRYYLNHPQEAKAIARAGYEHYWQNYSPELHTQRLFDYLNTGEIESKYLATADVRVRV
ncbi:MAG: glycosyltransferase [Cyanobacteria bacterium P01_D01_bin.73]